MGQTKWQSLLESFTNVIFGLLFAYAVQLTLIWAYDVEMSRTMAAEWVFWFTIASVVRCYFVRRLWNGEWLQTLRGKRNAEER